MIATPALRAATTAEEWAQAAVATGMGTYESLLPVGRDLFSGKKYSPDQPREHGRFAPGAGSDAVAGSLHEPDGGFTWSPKTGPYKGTGYAVSPYPERSEGIADVKDMSATEVAAKVQEYSAKNADLLSQPGHYVGGWHDPEDGRGYLDTVIVAKTPEEATSVALAHDQIAYFDFQTGQSVDVNRSATSGGAKG